MRTIDLINKLQDLVNEHEKLGMTGLMGDHEIYIDVFKKIESGNGYFVYEGVSGNIVIDTCAGGSMDVLSGFSGT